jgi:hypothetical protein
MGPFLNVSAPVHLLHTTTIPPHTTTILLHITTTLRTLQDLFLADILRPVPLPNASSRNPTNNSH